MTTTICIYVYAHKDDRLRILCVCRRTYSALSANGKSAKRNSNPASNPSRERKCLVVIFSHAGNSPAQ